MNFQIKNLKASLANTTQAMSGFLREDQLQALNYGSKSSNKWSDDIIKAAFQIRCACGIRGLAATIGSFCLVQLISCMAFSNI